MSLCRWTLWLIATFGFVAPVRAVQLNPGTDEAAKRYGTAFMIEGIGIFDNPPQVNAQILFSEFGELVSRNRIDSLHVLSQPDFFRWWVAWMVKGHDSTSALNEVVISLREPSTSCGIWGQMVYGNCCRNAYVSDIRFAFIGNDHDGPNFSTACLRMFPLYVSNENIRRLVSKCNAPLEIEGSPVALRGYANCLPHLGKLTPVDASYDKGEYNGHPLKNKLMGFMLFTTGGAISLFAHFMLFWSRWQRVRYWKRLSAGIAGWVVGGILILHSVSLLMEPERQNMEPGKQTTNTGIRQARFSQSYCATPSNSAMVQTWSASPASIAGVTLRLE